LRKKYTLNSTFSEVMVLVHCKAEVSTFLSFFSGKAGSEFFRSHTQSFPLTDCDDQTTGNSIIQNKQKHII